MLKKYLLYSTIFAAFSENFFFKLGIDWKLIYLIMFVNTILLFTKKYDIRNYLYMVAFLGFCLIHGFICSFILKIPITPLLSQVVGIGIMSFYFYLYVNYFNLQDIIRAYLKICVLVAIYGLFQYAYYASFVDPEFRLTSIFIEPSSIGFNLIPAFYIFYRQKKITLTIILGLALILTFSTLSYLGILLALIIHHINKKIIIYGVIIVPLIILITTMTYNLSENIKLRIDDSFNPKNLNILETKRFDKDTNISTYAILSNYYVSMRNLEEHPLGSGLGSHQSMHTKYIKEIHPPKYIRTLKAVDINRMDAASMTLRMISDFGIIGIALILLFFGNFAKVLGGNSSIKFMQIGIIIYFLLKLFRGGHYFPPEFFLFFWIYIYGQNKKYLVNAE